jgi:uncharacterized protein (TIGR02145 family)
MKNITIINVLISTIILINLGCTKEKTIPVVIFNPNLTYGILTDQDGNTYQTIQIGNQKWMAENLRTARYRNGDEIGTTTTAKLDITSEAMPRYQWAYGGVESNATFYGRLYTWYTVTDNRNVCPTGWHLPTDAEWTVLTSYLINNGFGFEGSGTDIGKAMAARSGWTTDPTAGNIGNNQAGNDSSGFTALPGGYRFSTGEFSSAGYNSYWWSATESIAPNVLSRNVRYSFSEMSTYSAAKSFGFSVRCLQDL